jgi:hypothetical protein
LFFFGGTSLFATAGAKKTEQNAGEKHKFFEKASMSYAQVFDFAFVGFFLPIIQNLGKNMDKREYIEILKRAAEAAGKQSGQLMAKSFLENGLAAFTTVLKKPDPFWQHALTSKIIEDTEKAFEIEVTECLWAKTFREAKAGEIGYATVCRQDYTMCQGFNPKIRMIRTKTLMQDHDHCNHRWIWEG